MTGTRSRRLAIPYLVFRASTLAALLLLGQQARLWADTVISTDQTQNGGNFANNPPLLVITHANNDPLLTLTAGATTSDVEALIVGGLNGESGRLLVEAGSSIDVDGFDTNTTYASVTISRGDVYLGLKAGSTGTVTVAGGGSILTNRHFDVGHGGAGNLVIEQGGTVESSIGNVAAENNSHGTVTVTGPGSTWVSDNNITIGQFGAGEMKIEDGGAVFNTGGYVGRYDSSSSTVTVSGADSQWICSTSLFLGLGGAGELNITEGGYVSNGVCIMGFQPDGSGTANVSGTGSTWNCSSGLLVGSVGDGELNITNGGVVTSAGAWIGREDSSHGTVSVTGLGSTWSIDLDLVFSGTLSTGTNGTSSLLVSTGGTVNVAGTTKLYGGGTVDLASGGNLNVQHFDFATGQLNFTGGTLTATGEVTGDVIVPDGGLVKGTGSFTSLAVGSGGTVSPGFSPQTMNITSADWQPAGKYLWEINALASGGGMAGDAIGWDLLQQSALSINADAGSPFIVEVHSLDSLDAAGLLDGFDAGSSYSWLIATAENGAFSDLSGLAIDATAFQNPLAGGTFSMESLAGGTQLHLTFTPVPEPSTWLLAVSGLIAMLVFLRRQR